MAQIIEVTCPECNATYQIEMPTKPRKPRGQLAGIALEDMTDEQLKREIINSKSVLYKAQQRQAAEDIIENAQKRVNAAIAMRDSRKAAQASADEEFKEIANAFDNGIDNNVDDDVEADAIYSEV